MTLPVERSRTRRPITWATIVGVLLLPVVIGGILVAALYNPTERLDNMSAAIVNDDEPVEIEGQLAPLGRQLAGGLVAGSDALDSNVSWTISNDEDAAAGLADGTYTAIVTIPENFSAAATSTAPGAVPEQATIEVQTAPNGRIVDEAITAQIAQTAASVFGAEVSKTYLTNVLLGVTTLHDQLGEAASGADELATGAGQAADGATQLADGAGQLADGAGQLATGASSLAGGAGQLSGGVGQLSSGATQLATGAAELSGGAASLAQGTADAATGLNAWADGGDQLAAGNRRISDALGQVAAQIPSDLPQVPQAVIDAANQVAANGTAINQQLTEAADRLTALAAQCDPSVTPDLCAGLDQAAQSAQDALPTATGIVDQAGEIATGLEGINQLPALGTALSTLADQSAQVSTGLEGLTASAQEAAGGVQALSDGAAQLSAGASGLQSGATTLAAGASTAASGASALRSGAVQLSGGASALAEGAGEAASGAGELATGITQLADGIRTLADGLGAAVAEIPAYTDDEAQELATVVADPVSAEGLGTNLFGVSAVPLLSVLVLWFGGLGSFVVLQAVSARALSSRKASVLLALGGFAPAAVIGAVQGALVAVVVQVAASYDWAEWSLFAALCVTAGIAFAAVNQALVALFGGAGRWIAAVVGALTLATGVVSTVPGVLTAVAGLLPAFPAYAAMLGALTPAGGVGAGLVGMLIWAALALVATTIVVAQRRKVSARALLTASAL
ncbi:YhgE/Pip family protein [Microbacterium sp. 18062]|uniref:YhgE/Pip family protein n=1 Tax=Microbacterium sp. 18062 TaxID=2681410 RepID=UPI001359213F|nr:YhgE/Pip family protein [Microbacterium sp. 18062]